MLRVGYVEPTWRIKKGDLVRPQGEFTPLMRPVTTVEAINKGLKTMTPENINVEDFEIEYPLFSKLLDANNLYDAFKNSQKGVDWKESVQRYEASMLKNINRTVKVLSNGTYVQKPFYEFPLYERGKRRHVKSLHISDRVINRAVCDYILNPSVQRYLIYDNGASIKGRGIGFTRKRLDRHLHQYYRKHGTNKGYVLLIDFRKFFDNIDHEKLLNYFNEKIPDELAMGIVTYLISTFEIDVSYMSDEEFSHCREDLFNSLEYYNNIPKELHTGEKMMRKSLGIGSQISQISGILYPTQMDNYCKIVRGLHYYGRYMDDTYVIHESKEYLQNLLGQLVRICTDLGIHVNEKKTQICPLTKFTFLKTKYNLTETGKIIKNMPHDNIVRERRKLKRMANLVKEGKIHYSDVRNGYGSWRGNAQWYNAYQTIRRMDELHNKLFVEDWLYDDSYY